MHVPPPVIFAVGWAAQSLIIRLTRRSDPPVAAKAAGLTVGVASIVLMGGTAVQFSRAGTTVDPARPEQASSLVVSGPNRLTRNPIYLGFAGLLTAHALWRATPAALLPVAGFVAALTPQIGHEEEALLTRFGGDYGSYVRRVPRWVGRPRS